MNDKKLSDWDDERGDPNNLINDHLVGSELEIIINCENAQLKITACNSDALQRILKLTDAVFSENKK